MLFESGRLPQKLCVAAPMPQLEPSHIHKMPLSDLLAARIMQACLATSSMRSTLLSVRPSPSWKLQSLHQRDALAA